MTEESRPRTLRTDSAHCARSPFQIASCRAGLKLVRNTQQLESRASFFLGALCFPAVCHYCWLGWGGGVGWGLALAGTLVGLGGWEGPFWAGAGWLPLGVGGGRTSVLPRFRRSITYWAACFAFSTFSR